MTTRPAPPWSPSRPRLLALVAGAVLLAACAGTGPAPSAGPETGGGLGAGAPAASLDTLTQPMEITSRNRVLDVTLRATFQNLFVADTPQGSTMRLRTYQVMNANGVDYTDSAKYGFPAPTLRAYPGDSIHIVLQNRMFPEGTNTECMDYPAADSIDKFEDCFHGANWTNIHYHGMHVTPDSVGDDVLLLIPPGQDHEYGFRIPANQSPGTHWYHPHKHGSVAIQVMNGMTGAIVVDGGPLDSLADAHGMVEKVIAMQQIDSLPNLIDVPPGANTSVPLTLVNGKVTPVIVMRPGEVQRWRLVDENVTKTAAFRVAFRDDPGEEPAMYDVARDGVTYADTNYAPGGVLTRDTSVLVAPGNRLDVFVQAPRTSGLFLLRGTSVGHDRPGDETRKDGLRDDQDPTTVRGRRGANAALGATATNALFYVYVDSTLAPNGSSLPASLPPLQPFLANLPGSLNPQQILADSANLAVVVFASTGRPTGNSGSPPRFFVGTARNPFMQFDSDSVYVPRNAANDSMPMVLDSVQTWKVMNQTNVNHPFHIHINPFQVIDVFYPNPNDPNAALYAQLDSAAQQRGSPIWLDVLPLPQNNGTVAGYALIRQGYEPFRNPDGSICTSCGPAFGEFVMHCHILGHEERGMMQVIEIVPTAGMAPGQGLRTGGHGTHGGHGSGSGSSPEGSGHRH
ncbi:MAG TPA: multicopper oxidase domain-containing protein [Longimicrobium sp.]|uniref:multicopper oxidase family protein n=1 Tax=Longimicrobium sp. TaxID=2029185 RepID=UPI002ED899F2